MSEVYPDYRDENADLTTAGIVLAVDAIGYFPVASGGAGTPFEELVPRHVAIPLGRIVYVDRQPIDATT